MKKRLMPVALVVLLMFVALSVVACGGTETGSTVPYSYVSPITTTSTTEATAGPSPDATTPLSPATGQPIRIGVISSLHGYLEGPGANYSDGIRYQSEFVNAHGGIDGRPLDLVEYDDHTDIDPTIAAAAKLIQEDAVFAILGPFNQPGQDVVRGMEENAGMLGVLGGPTTMAEQNDNVSYTWSVAIGQDSTTMVAACETVIRDMGWKSIVGIADELAMHQETLDVLAHDSAGEGYGFVRMTDRISLQPDLDVQPVVDRIVEEVNAAGADSITLQLSSYFVAPVMKGLRAAGIDLPVLCSSAAASSSLFSEGPEAVEGIYIVQSGGSANPEALSGDWPSKQMLIDFKKGYKASRGVDADAYTCMGADLVNVLVAAMKRADDPEDKEAVREALVNLKYFVAFGGVVTFEPESTDVGIRGDVILWQVKNGDYEFVQILS